MDIKKISFLAPKGEDEINNETYKVNVIQKDFIICENYSIGYSNEMTKDIKEENLNSDSIYGFGYIPINANYNYIPNQLLDEVCNYGETLLKICQKYIDKMKPLTFFGLNQKDSLKNLIKEVDSKPILKVFLKWCNKNGFPIAPIEKVIPNDIHDLRIVYYELDYSTIKELTLHFIIIYLSQTFFCSIKYIIDINYKSVNKISQQKSDEVTDLFDFLNKYGPLCNIINYNFDENIFDKQNEITKIEIIDKLIKNMVSFLNTYSDIFNHTSEKYFSYDENEYRIYHQQIYSNIFDICWDLIAENYNQCFQITKKCQGENCSQRIPNRTNKKYCDECAKKNKKNSASKTQRRKKVLMKNLLETYELFPHLYNDEIKEELKLYEKLLSKGHSAEREDYRITKVKELEKKMNSLVNSSPL